MSLAEDPARQRTVLLERCSKLEEIVRRLMLRAVAHERACRDKARDAAAKRDQQGDAYWTEMADKALADIEAARELVGQ